MSKIPDEKILQWLQSGETHEVDSALSYLHRQVFRMTVRFVTKYKGTFSDAEDVFQDGMVVLYKMARQDKLLPDTKMEAYLFSICKNLWFKQFRKKHEAVELTEAFDAIPDLDNLPIFSLMEKEQQAIIEKLIGIFGADCQKVLVAYYYDRLRMSKIAEMMGYANEQVAKNKKADCMKKLRNLLDGAVGVFEP